MTDREAELEEALLQALFRMEDSLRWYREYNRLPAMNAAIEHARLLLKDKLSALSSIEVEAGK